MDAAYYTEPGLSPDELAENDRVYGALTEATRRLALAQLQSRVDLSTIEKLTAQLDEITDQLNSTIKPGSFGTEIGPGRSIRNHGNSVVGLRNPFAALIGPNKIVWNERGASVSFHLNALYEGPPGLVHGGVSALLLDQLLGESAAAGGSPGMTGTYTLRYRRPTPLGDLSMEGWVESSDGVKTFAKGHIKDAEGNITVEAEGVFIAPKWARTNPDWKEAKRLFE
jgi:acyl-coenzyme A thioesterase PaaI-like protein